MMTSCGSCHGIKTVIGFTISLLILMICPGPSAAQGDDFFIGSGDSSGDSFDQDLTRAQTMFDDGITTMNESTIRNAANLYEQIIQDYPNDPRHFNAYFASAFIHIEYLQGFSDIEHAQNLLNLLINNHPSAYPEVADALLTLAQLEYRVLGDYRSAQEHLSAILNAPLLSRQLEYRDVETKVLLAKCRQKLAEYEKAYDIWTEVHLYSEAYDTEGRLMWLENWQDWQYIDDGTIRLYFEGDVEWQEVLSSLRDSMAIANRTWGLMSTKPVYVFLYESTDSLFDYTLRYDGFALPDDCELHMSPADIEETEHFAGWLASAQVNIRADDSCLPILRAGFDHYFMGSRSEVNYIAAKEIFFYGELLTDEYILFPISFSYTYSDEFAGLSSSFLHYLIDDGDVSLSSLKEFNRLLLDTPTARIVPPMMAELAQASDDVTVVGRQENLISPAQLYDLFHTKLGIELNDALAGWRTSLTSDVTRVEQEFQAMTGSVEVVNVDLSTPESALRTYWDAYIHGDINTLIEASTEEPAQFLSDAKELYEEQGILEAVMIESFIIPNRGAVMRVIFEEEIAEDRYVYQVRIERSGDFEDRTFLLRKEGSDWKVDTN